MKEIEIEGKTVTMAVESGLRELGLRRDQVEVQVLQEGTAGFLGMGGKLARVRIRQKLWGEGTGAGAVEEEEDDNRGNRILPEAPKSRGRSPAGGNSGYGAERRASPRPARPPRPQEPSRAQRPRSSETRPREILNRQDVDIDTAKACEISSSVLREILSLAGLADAAVKCSWSSEQSRVKAEVETADTETLIGKDGKALESLQFLVTVIAGRKLGVPVAVQVEADGYWRKIEEKVLSEVERALDEVKRTGRPYRFEPMEPALRRLVHRSLANNPDVETVSEGEGSWRKVVLRPRAK